MRNFIDLFGRALIWLQAGGVSAPVLNQSCVFFYISGTVLAPFHSLGSWRAQLAALQFIYAAMLVRQLAQV